MQLEAGEVLSVEFLCNVIILAVKFSLRKVKVYSLRSIFISRGTLGIAAEGFTCRGWSSTVQSQSWRCQIFWQQATVPWRLLLGESVRYPLVKKKSFKNVECDLRLSTWQLIKLSWSRWTVWSCSSLWLCDPPGRSPLSLCNASECVRGKHQALISLVRDHRAISRQLLLIARDNLWKAFASF